MLIVAGSLHLRPEDRDRWVDARHEVLRRARAAPGCIDITIAADPIDEGRVNLFEHWESEAALAGWRAVANPPPKPEILCGDVRKHRISSSGPPF